MFKFGKKIMHLGDKSLHTFLCERSGTVVLYGMGEEGTIAYNALIKNGIKIAAVADGSPQKQGTVIGEHTILSYNELVASASKDALICVTIADRKIADSVVGNFSDAGFENIIKIMVKDPVGMCIFSEFDTYLPSVLVGTNSLAKRIKNHLEENGALVNCFCNAEEDKGEFCGLPIKLLADALGEHKQTNVIICDDAQYMSTVLQLRKNGVICNAYRGIMAGMGEFRINKYKQGNLALFKALLYVLSHTNAIYHSQQNTATKDIFKQVLQSGLRAAKNAYTVEDIAFNDDELFVLYSAMGEEVIRPKSTFNKVESEAVELVHFMATMKQLCIDQKAQVQLLEEGSELKVVW